MKHLLLRVGIVVTALTGSLAHAQQKVNSAPRSADTRFMRMLARGELAEVTVGRVATQKASDPGIRHFAEQMVKDHSKNNRELKSIAGGKNVKLPATPDAEHVAAQQKLQDESGADFDSDYIKGQVEDHEKTAELLEGESRAGRDSTVRQFAADMLPVVNHHLAMAKQLQDKLASRGRR